MEVLKELSKFLAAWGSLIATLILVAITGWYAFLTKRLADSSERAARYAQEAAEASRMAADVAQASAKVKFEVSPIFSVSAADAISGAAGWTLAGVGLVSEGASVYVHGMSLEGYSVPHHGDHRQFTPKAPLELSLEDDGEATDDLPIRVHEGERLDFELEEEIPERPAEISVSGLECVVRYSFDGKAPVRTIRVEYRGTPGRDYDVPDIWAPLRRRWLTVRMKLERFVKYGDIPWR